MVFEVNKKFPLTQYESAQEGCYSMVGNFLDFVFLLEGISKQEVLKFKKETMRYGVFDKDSIPFVLFDFNVMNFDSSINFKKSNNTQLFIDSDANLMNLYLVEKRSFILKGMRSIGVKEDVAESLRQTASSQMATYDSILSVDSAINKSLLLNTTDRMISSSEMIKTSNR